MAPPGTSLSLRSVSRRHIGQRRPMIDEPVGAWEEEEPNAAGACQEQGQDQEQHVDVIDSNGGDTTSPPKRIRRKKKRRIPHLEHQHLKGARGQVSVARWGAGVARMFSPATEQVFGSREGFASNLDHRSCASEMPFLPNEGSHYSTTPMVGCGAASGTGEAQSVSLAKVAPAPEDGDLENMPNKDDDEDSVVEQQGLNANKIPAAQRRFEEPLTSVQTVFMPVIEHDAFYYVVMSAIAINCVQLAATSPLEDDPQLMKDINSIIDWVLFGVFTLEFILKHLALKLSGYWEDNWNRLDGTIVVVGYLAFVPGVGDYPAIRVLRIIRPLRVIGKLDGMKKIMITIGAAVNGLFDTLLLCCLIFFMFGIMAIVLFAGVTRQRCYASTTSGGTTTWALTAVERPCGGWYECPGTEKCMYHTAAPSYSLVSFDNILIGFLTLFVNITLEGWVDVMYLIQDGYSYWASTIFFHVLILVGSLFVLNLALAVISDAYENQEADWEAAEREASSRLRKVRLDEEAIKLEALGTEVRSLQEEKDGLENSLEYCEEDEQEMFEKDIEDVTEAIRKVAETVTDMSNTLLAQENCHKEADILLPVAKLMLESIEEEEEIHEPTPAEMEEKWNTDRETMPEYQVAIHKVAVSGIFDKIIMFFIIFNTVCLAMEHTKTEVVNGIQQAVPMDKSMDDMLVNLNYLFIVVFTMECVIKISGLGFSEYRKDNFNNFDLFIVIMSYVELGFAGNSSLSALRTFRLARVFKLAKNWKSLRDLINTIISTLPAMSYLSILLLLFMFISAVAGMMFFGGKFKQDEIEGRHLFDNFGIAMLTVFQMLTGENWNSVLYDGINATSPVCAIYFLIVQVLGNFVILNLFLAILLSNFGGEDEDEGGPSTWELVRGMLCGSAKVEPEENGEKEMKSETEHEAPANQRKTADLSKSIAAVQQDIALREAEAAKKPAVVLSVEDMDVSGTSVFCFPEDDIFRRQLALLVGWTPKGQETVNTPFANFIFVMIIVSSITLAIDEPTLSETSDTKHVLNILDVIFTAIFTIEMCIKIIVYGFFFTDDSYMSDAWNVLDFFIVLTSILALPSNPVMGGSSDSPFAVLRVLRTFRALRPLRMINRAPGLKVVVDAIFKCLPAFFNIFLVSWLVYLVFAIMGVQLWAGKFWACNDTTVSKVAECTGTMSDGTARVWANKPLNFDNVLNAQLTLFEVASLEIWLDVMYAAMDVQTELGDQPVRNSSWPTALYFVVFIVIGSFLLLNLFVGAVVDNFNRIKDEMDKKGAVMTEEQEAFVQSLQTMFNKKPSAKATAPDKNDGCIGYMRYKVFKFITYDWFARKETVERRNMGLSTRKKVEEPLFDHIIMALISMNILVMAAPIWVQPPTNTEVQSTEYFKSQESDWNNMLELINSVFNFIFVLECILKLIGFGYQQYFSSNMNTFDFCIVGISLAGFVVDRTLENVDPGLMSVISVIKALRVVRIFRLAMRIKGIRRLLETLIYTLPSLMNVTCLLLIILFIYTVLGMAFFGDQEFNKPPYELYEVHANFRSFHIGFFTLFRMSTGESWNGIMHDSMEEVSPQAWIYYSSYMIVGSSLLFQLIVAVVLEQFGSAAAEDEAVVTPDDIENYAVAWTHMDPEGTNYMSFGKLPLFLRALDPPLGVGDEATTADILVFMNETALMSHGGQVHYVETFFSLVTYAYKRKFGRRWKGTLDEDMLIDMTKLLTEGFPSVQTLNLGEANTAEENFAALKIQSLHRKKMAARAAATKSKGNGGPMEGKSGAGLAPPVLPKPALRPPLPAIDSEPSGKIAGEEGLKSPPGLPSALPPLPVPDGPPPPILPGLPKKLDNAGD